MRGPQRLPAAAQQSKVAGQYSRLRCNRHRFLWLCATRAKCDSFSVLSLSPPLSCCTRHSHFSYSHQPADYAPWPARPQLLQQLQALRHLCNKSAYFCDTDGILASNHPIKLLNSPPEGSCIQPQSHPQSSQPHGHQHELQLVPLQLLQQPYTPGQDAVFYWAAQHPQTGQPHPAITTTTVTAPHQLSVSRNLSRSNFCNSRTHCNRPSTCSTAHHKTAASSYHHSNSPSPAECEPQLVPLKLLHLPQQPCQVRPRNR
jgi:hypothetical protein